MRRSYSFDQIHQTLLPNNLEMKLLLITVFSGISLASLTLMGCQPSSDTQASAQEISSASAPADRPNILLFVADDMGFTDLGSFGGEIPTPNLDALAYGGVRFNNFHAAPLCAPARAMLLSGMSNHEAGMGSMYLKRDFDNGRVPSPDTPGYAMPGYEGYLSYRVAALPEVLRDAGYHTYMAGKWDLGRAFVEEHNPAGRGFERSFVHTTAAAVHLPPDDLVAHGGIPRADPLVFRENWDVVAKLAPDYFSTKTFTNKIIEYIDADRHDPQPFFAYLALSAPHFPLQVPEDWRDKYAGEYAEGYDIIRDRRVMRAADLGILSVAPDMKNYKRQSAPWSSLDSEEQRRNEKVMEIYAAMIGNMDFHIGRLIDYLRETNQLHNTFILFMSDNGTASRFRPEYANNYDNSVENIGANNSFVAYGQGWAEAGMAPFRGVKGAMTEGGVRVAAFANHSSIHKPGRISQAYLTMQDVMPTLLKLAGAKHPGSQFNNRPVLAMRGSSFLDLLRVGDGSVHANDEVIGWELSGKRALVRGNWKLLRMPKEPDSDTKWELYDLRSDPYERRDVASTDPELTRELVDEWYDYAEEVGVAVVEDNRIYNGFDGE